MLLGATNIEITKLGIGAWSWGDRLYWSFGNEYNYYDIEDAFNTCINAGINFIDTAESYGWGQSERYLGEFIHKTNFPILIATKFMPYPWRLKKSRLINALKKSLQRLKLQQVDLYQIHWPLPPINTEVWADGLSDSIDEGLTKAVGVSNFNMSQMLRTMNVLQKRGKNLTSNQVIYNILNRDAELNGMLDFCKKEKITLIAYSPLSQGLLTGKYHVDNPPSGVRRIRYSRKLLNQIQPLIILLREIGKNHGGKTPTQVAINWVICKGAVPIPGVKNAIQAKEIIGSLGWQLTIDEVTLLENESQKILA